jgi:quercetin dioxygenase-like cupin family protein
MNAPNVDARDRWFLGTLLRLVADGGDTNGQLLVMEQHAAKGFSPPLHVHHREDTALLVLEGTLTVRVGDVDRQITNGGFAWLPREVPHSFRVDSDRARFLEFATPAGIEGFHLATSEPALANELPAPTEPDIGQLVRVGAEYGTDIIGPPM